MTDPGSAASPPREAGPETTSSASLYEDADISTSSEDYARRFAGPVGEWFVALQAEMTRDLLRMLPQGASVLDVGGGHAQIAPPLIEAGYRVTVVGSAESCGERLKPWLDSGVCRFEVADLRALPYPDRSYDAVVCFRLLPHSISWTRLIASLCRVARQSVVVDYPSLRSVNILSDRLFALKKGIESNTRSFLMFTPGQIGNAFHDSGFAVHEERPQFLLPMALHRWANTATLSKIAETPGRLLGLTRRFGSPVIVRADRRGSRA